MFFISILHQSLHHLSSLDLTSELFNYSENLWKQMYKNLQPPITSQNRYAVVAEAAGRQVFMSTTRLEPPLLSLQVRLDRV
jgi:hypothetical protein